MKAALCVLLLGAAALLAASFAAPTFTGLEATAAAGQVKTGASYIQARAEMNFWNRTRIATQTLGVALIGLGVIFAFTNTKTTK